MESLVITLPPRIYRNLQQRATQSGEKIETFTTALIEVALQKLQEPQPVEREGVRQLFQANGRLRLLGPALRYKIISDVTLEEVRAALTRVGGQPLSEVIQEQRGTQP